MRIISIINFKGGVGKTISTVNIATILANQGKRILIVDLSSQANATQFLKSYAVYDDAVTINEVFLDKDIDIKTAIVKTENLNLDILTSHIKFAFAESKMLIEGTRPVQTMLKKALAQIQDDYDYCLLDCPSNIGIITINALVAADEVIVPIKIDQFALSSLENLLQSIAEIKNEINHNLKYLGSFVTMDNNTMVNKAIKKQLTLMPAFKMFKTSVRQNNNISESTFYQVPVVSNHINANTDARATIDYIELVEELLDREKSIV